MRRTGALLGAAGLIAVLAAGCTQVAPGEPRPVESSAGGTSSGGPSVSRPHEIDLTGKDPCALVPESDLPSFDVEKAGVPDQNEEFDAPMCSYNGNHDGYWVMLVTTEGIEWWFNEARDAEVEEVDPVDGFPAITVTGDFDSNRCDVVVDIAEGQYMRTTARADDTDVPRSENCENAYKLAESAMSTLVGK